MNQEHEGLLHRLFGRHEHAASRSAALNLDDIQGFILRGYRMPMVRHFAYCFLPSITAIKYIANLK
jgi:hypothetical protein